MARGDPAVSAGEPGPVLSEAAASRWWRSGAAGYGVPDLDRQVERYVAMADHYIAAAGRPSGCTAAPAGGCEPVTMPDPASDSSCVLGQR